MPRIAYVNGRYLRHERARVHVEDRGYQFADGVYEVVVAWRARLLDLDAHLDRLGRSLDALEIAWPLSRAALLQVMAEVLRLNRYRDALIYVQVTRGVAPRDHGFPKRAVPQLVVTARRLPPVDPARINAGVSVITMPDIRWGRCDIKSISLLPNVLAKQNARLAGAFEAWMIDAAGNVTEGSSTNAWIVTADGTILTRPLGHDILAGVTRAVVTRLAAECQLRVVERAFSLEEAKQAREAFLTSATSFVLPVTRIDGAAVGTGAPGPIAHRLRQLYLDLAEGRAPIAAASPS